MVYNRVTVMQNNTVLAQCYIKVLILGTPEPTGLHSVQQYSSDSGSLPLFSGADFVLCI